MIGSREVEDGSWSQAEKDSRNQVLPLLAPSTCCGHWSACEGKSSVRDGSICVVRLRAPLLLKDSHLENSRTGHA